MLHIHETTAKKPRAAKTSKDVQKHESIQNKYVGVFFCVFFLSV